MQEHNTTLKYKDKDGELHVHYPYTVWDNVLNRPAVATLDTAGKVPTSQLPAMDYVPTSEKGTAGGVATLGDDGKVPSSQLPAAEAGGGFTASDTAPDDTDLLWIDTANGNLIKFHNGTDWEPTSAIAVWG